MVALHLCSACRFGRHEDHVKAFAPAPEGMMGGFECPCQGDCDTYVTVPAGSPPIPESIVQAAAASMGPVPVDGKPKHIWPSWREALLDAHLLIDHAYDRRRRVFQSAFDAGLTCAQIGETVGMSAAGVHKVIGRQRGGPDLLDAPANATTTFQQSQEDR